MNYQSQFLLLTLLVIATQAKLIDLSHKHSSDTMTLFNSPRFNRTTTFVGDILPGVYAESGQYFSVEHSGTHIDAPSHFSKGGQTLDNIPLEHTVIEGVMIDCSNEAKIRPNYLVSVQKIREWEQQHGQIPKEAAVIFNFGWSSKYNNPTAYVGTASSEFSDFVFPTLSPEAGLWLYEERSIRILGTDTISPEIVSKNNKKSTFIHTKYLTNDRLIIENLFNTESLPATGFRFHASPVKFVGGTGVQVRAYAMTYDQAGMNSCLVVHPVGNLKTYALLSMLSVTLLSTL
uniref:Kynurenine formamidase n=1 Tax=Arion vulgaris TaxID=1028688 RepID=A0A0B7AH96_9EUPU